MTFSDLTAITDKVSSLASGSFDWHSLTTGDTGHTLKAVAVLALNILLTTISVISQIVKLVLSLLGK